MYICMYVYIYISPTLDSAAGTKCQGFAKARTRTAASVTKPVGVHGDVWKGWHIMRNSRGRCLLYTESVHSVKYLYVVSIFL
jgi:hypothetical protein